MICPTHDTLSDLMDGAVPVLDRWRLRWHIRHCSDCARRLQEEEQLRDCVRSVAAMATAPAALRSRVANVLQADSTQVRKPYLLPSRLVTTSLVAGCVLLGLLSVSPVSVLLLPRPAYAQVVTAMRQVKTARWQESFFVYDTRPGRNGEFTLHCIARLNPPALRTEYPEGHHGLQTMETDWTNNTRTVSPEMITIRQQKLRDNILNQIMAPESLGRGPNSWQSERVMLEGQMLLRFSAGMGEGRQLSPDAKLTGPGYRSVMWVNPTTLRVVRSLKEYYDGQQHTRIIGSNFEYDQPIRPDIFSK